MFSFSSISHFTRQYYWGSSARYTVVYEHKGWFTGAPTNMVTNSNSIIYQRPALLNVSDHYNRDYNGVCNTEVFHFQYLLANVHTISVILYMRVSFLCISSFLGSAIARFLLDIK